MAAAAAAAVPLAPRMVVVERGVAAPSPDAAAAFITGHARGPYTSARTVGFWAVLEFEAHVARIAESARLMMAAGDPPSLRPLHALTAPAELRPRVLRCLRAGLDFWAATHGAAGTELKITLRAEWASPAAAESEDVRPASTSRVCVHVCECVCVCMCVCVSSVFVGASAAAVDGPMTACCCVCHCD